MSKLFNVDRFISVHVTERKESLFSKDLLTFHERLTEKTEGRSALVIGGAGTIGSSFIKALLNLILVSFTLLILMKTV